FWDIHNDFFEEIAKLRAARRIWARHMKERYGAKDPRSLMMRFHSQTAGVTLTAQQPENNVVRVAYQAMAAVLGGTQSLHTNSMDEALGLPTHRSAPLAPPARRFAPCAARDAAGARLRDGRCRYGRSARGFVLRRVAHGAGRAGRGR